MVEELLLKEDYISALRRERKSILLYGMGSGADKIYALLEKNGIRVSGVFASDGFVRGHCYRGMRVLGLREAEERYGDFTAVQAFGYEGEGNPTVRALRLRHRVYVPNLPVYGGGLIDKEYLRANAARIERLYESLADDYSRRVFSGVLELSVTGDPSVTERIESICEPPAQYFSHRRLHIDIGAHHGDTVAAYALRNPGCSGIIALEPDRVSYGRLCENTAGMPAVTAMNCAASDREGISRFSGGGGRGSALDGEGGDAVRTVTVDSLCGNTAVGANGKRVGSIRIDAEGEDMKVLYGAANTIWNDRPALCVAVYHRAYDIIELPRLLTGSGVGYRLSMGKKNCMPAWDVFLFAAKK